MKALNLRAAGALAALAASGAALAPAAAADPTSSWVYETEYLTTRSDKEGRDLQGLSVTAMRSWRFDNGFEAQLGLGLLGVDGEVRDPFTGEAPRESDALGLRAGGRVRYNFPSIGPVTPFADGYAGVLWSPGSPFPDGGTAVNGMAQWGGGAEFALNERWSVQAGWRNTHVSNGGGLVDYNPAWNAEGAFIGFRRSLGKTN